MAGAWSSSGLTTPAPFSYFLGVRTSVLRSATLLVAILAAACGSSSSPSQSPPGSTLCIGATAPKPLATLSGPPRSLDVRDGRLAATSYTAMTDENGAVIVVDLADGTVRTLASGRSGGDRLAIGPGDAYWMEIGGLVRAPLDGSGPPEAVLSIVASAFDTMFDGSTLYFAYYRDSTHTVVASLADGAGTAVDLTGDVSPLFFAGDTRQLYWTDCAGGGVFGVPKGGGSPQLLADAICPYGIATDGVDLYYADVYGDVGGGSHLEGLLRVPVNGGTSTVVSEDAQPSTNLAMDEQSVYFGGGDGSLNRVPKSGGAAERLAAGPVQNVALDGTCVYWTDSATYTIFTLPK